jgi:hypothetical protein
LERDATEGSRKQFCLCAYVAQVTLWLLWPNHRGLDG